MKKPKLPQLSNLDVPTLDLPGMGADLSMPNLGLMPPKAAGAADDDDELDPVEETEAAILDLTTIKGRAKAEEERFMLAVDTEYWFCVCFETRAQKDEFIAKAKFTDLGDKHLNGLLVAERMGIKLTSPRPKWSDARLNKQLAAIADTGDPTED